MGVRGGTWVAVAFALAMVGCTNESATPGSSEISIRTEIPETAAPITDETTTTAASASTTAAPTSDTSPPTDTKLPIIVGPTDVTTPGITAPDGTPATFVPNDVAFRVENNLQRPGDTWDVKELEAFYDVYKKQFLAGFNAYANAGTVTDDVRAQFGAVLVDGALRDLMYELPSLQADLNPQLLEPKVRIIEIVDQTADCVVVKTAEDLSTLVSVAAENTRYDFLVGLPYRPVRWRQALRTESGEKGPVPSCDDFE